MDPRRAVPPKGLTFKPWQPNQAATPRASRIPDDQWAKYKDRIVKWHGIGFTQPQIKTLLEQSRLTVTKDQLHTQMSEVWGLKVKSRGSGAQNLHSDIDNDVEETVYDTFAMIDDDNASLAAYELPLRTYERESSRASLQSLLPLQGRRSRDAFAVGAVLAIIDGVDPNDGRYKCNVWLVASPAEDRLFCVRIKTYQGRGIAHLAEGMRQCDIDAHAVIHVHGEKPVVSAAEPRMKKEPLAIVLEAGIDGSALSAMSRACFIGYEPMAYDIEAVLIGRLDKFSVALLEIYGIELCGGGDSQG